MRMIYVDGKEVAMFLKTTSTTTILKIVDGSIKEVSNFDYFNTLTSQGDVFLKSI